MPLSERTKLMTLPTSELPTTQEAQVFRVLLYPHRSRPVQACSAEGITATQAGLAVLVGSFKLRSIASRCASI